MVRRIIGIGLAGLMGGILGSGAQTPPAGHLVNRYSFTSNASDSVGGAHGQLMGGATIASGAAVLDGISAYVNLPNNLCTGLTSATFEAWLTDTGAGGWARLYDFGKSSGGEDAQGGGVSYIFLAWPAGGGASLRGCYRPPGAGETYLDVSPRPAQGVAHHFAWTQDATGRVANIYIDGALVGTHANFTCTPAAVGPTVNDWLGRSQYNDPYFKGSIDEFRIYDFALPAAEVARNYQLGPDAAPLGPAQFLAQPQGLTVGEGQPFTLSADVTGAPPFSFQWYRNGLVLAGATNETFAGTALLADDGASYQLWVTNSFTNTIYVAASSNALLRVNADLEAPRLLGALSLGTNGIELRFSEPLRADTATNLANYAVSGPAGAVAVSTAVQSPSGNVVTLGTAPLVAAATYTVAVSGVRDRAAAANLIAAGAQASFVATPVPVRDVGNPPMAGALQYTNTGNLALAGAGADIGGAADQGSMTAVSVTGDFDQQVRLAGFIAPDPLAKVGLMARETLDANSRFSAVLASPGLMGCWFASREAVGAAATVAGQFPVNYPQTWLRLRRAGSVFTGYASYDGLTWTPLGSATLGLSNTLQVGVMIASHGRTPATALFTNAGNTASSLTGVVANPGEPLGPSSRRTQLVISEIMFRPAARADGRNLEFVEIFNANPWSHDLSGHRLGGDVDYTFPAGTILAGGGFIVVGAVPSDLQAVYGLGGVHGPYQGSLKSKGTVRLYDEGGMRLLEVSYKDAAPWPMGADGTGHSIVLARPSFGEADPRAWDRSDAVGGSPGAFDSYTPGPLRNVVINEIMAHTDPPDIDSIELYNHANTAVDVSGCTLSDDPLLNKFVIPTNTVIPARGFVYFTDAQMGFSLNAAGETIYFRNPDGSRVLDAVKFEAQENGVSFGRSPDGGSEWYRLAAKTFGTNNAAPRLSSVVINEIMYHPISSSDDDQYVELHNRGASAVSLAGWRFVEGINYAFPSNTVLAPGGYLVVAANALRLRTNYAQLNATNTLGNFSGRLSGKGERLALAMPDTIVGTNASGFLVTNHIDIVVEEVTYGTGGRWGAWSDGGGSSLELVDARADRRLAANWADSDESAKAPWANVEATGVLDYGANYAGGTIGYAQVGLMDAGECLVDNVEVLPGPNGPNYVANPDFSAGLANWSLQGAFSRSSLQAAQGYGGSGAALQLRTGNRLFTLGNSAQCALTNTSLASGQTATLRYKARWLRGARDIVFRLNGNWLEAAGTLPVPANCGTPGMRNSRAATNAPPAIYDVKHSPSLPAGGEVVTVSARVSDPDSVTSVALRYRVDPATAYTTLTMRDDGTGGDAIAGDGVFSATLPAAGAGATIAFVVQATDGLGAQSRFPALVDDNGPARECLVRYGDPEPPGAFGIYHLWLSQANVTRWLTLPIMSNEEMDATLVYRGRVIYNAGARYSGSPYHESVDGPAGTRACHYIWSMPQDDLFLGTAAFNKIHWPGNDIQDDTVAANNNDSTLQREQTANTFLRGLGVPWVSRRYVVVYVNGTRRGQVMEDALRPSGSVPEAYFPDDSGGSLYKIQPWFEGTAFPNSGGYIAWENKSWAIVAPYRTTGGGYKTARYRWHYEPRDVAGSANDYTNVFTLLDAMNAYDDPNYSRIVNGVVDVDQWLRVVAANHAAGNWDCYGVQNGQNLYGYLSPQRRWQLFMFDFNIVLGNRISWGPGANLEATQETAWERMYGAGGRPEFRRLYWRALKELVNGPMQSGTCNPLLDAKYAALTASGIAAASPQPIKDWVASARASIAGQVASHDAAAFSVQAGPVTTSSNVVALSGSAPLEVDSFLVNGRSGVVTWTSPTAWRLLATVAGGTQSVAVVGVDRKGNLVPGASNAVTVINTAVPEAPEGRVVFNEIMHHPVEDRAEYVELFNAAINTPFDLGGWQVNGLGYTFPMGSVIFPQQYLVLAGGASAYARSYGVSNVAAGVYDGHLQADGETLSLLRPGSVPGTQVVVDRVRYETNAPWPAAASRPGTALQLLDPAQDNSRVANWTALTNTVIPPPEWLYASVTGTATSSKLYLYLTTPGDIFVDDLKLVAGPAAEQGVNLLANGDFESNLSTGWGLAGDLVSSVRDTTVKHGGLASLHLIATGNGGSGNNDAVYQTLAPALTNGMVYTVSFWYRPTTTANGGKVVVRLSNSTANTGLYAAVDSTPAPPMQFTLLSPGAANSVRTNLPAFPPLWLNEVQPQNLTGPKDNYGERDPWLEIYNAGQSTQSLAGLYLGTNCAASAQWAFPAGATIAPGQFLVVWLDGQPEQSAGGTNHTSFRLSGPAGSIILSRYVSNAVQVVDYLNYAVPGTSYSYGDVPDGQPFYRQPMFVASPGATNGAAPAPITVFINEWMAENTGFITDPGTTAYDDWFELYNPSDAPAELAGYYLSDSLTNAFQYQIPAGYRVPAHGFLLVWADSKTSANSTNSPDLHVNFKLNKDGEAIGLFGADGTAVDYVSFGAQSPNVAEGRYPDGGNLRLFMPTPSPGAPNVLPPAEQPPTIRGLNWAPGGAISFTFPASPGHTYRVEFKDDLNAANWIPLGADQFATGPEITVTDPGPAVAQRYYRVVLVN